jgi:hypothetical protein
MRALISRGWALALPLAIAAAVAALLPSTAYAAAGCFPRETIVAHLAERYGEHPVAAGVSRGRLLLLLIRPDGASWTILLVPPGAGGGELACPLAVGEGWRALDASQPEAEPAPESSS